MNTGCSVSLLLHCNQASKQSHPWQPPIKRCRVGDPRSLYTADSYACFPPRRLAIIHRDPVAWSLLPTYALLTHQDCKWRTLFCSRAPFGRYRYVQPDSADRLQLCLVIFCGSFDIKRTQKTFFFSKAGINETLGNKSFKQVARSANCK